MVILTVTLNPALDKTLKGKFLFLGQENRYADTHFSAGGKGLNVSRALQGLRVNNLATGFLAGHTGCLIEDILDREKIPHQFIRIDGETRVSITVVASNRKHPARFLEAGPVVKARDIINFRKKYRMLLKKCHYVVLSGRNIPGARDGFYHELITLAARQKVLAALDTSGPALLNGLLARPFLIKPNRNEAEFVLRRTLRTQSDIKKAIQIFLKRGIANVIISLGRHGAVGSQGGAIWLAQPPAHRTTNTVGCGDSFLGGFLSLFMKGVSFEKALRLGVAVATANALNLHPGYFSKQKVVELEKRVKIRKI